MMGDELIVDTAAWREEARRYILGTPPYGATQNPYLLHNRILALIDALEETEGLLFREREIGRAMDERAAGRGEEGSRR